MAKRELGPVEEVVRANLRAFRAHASLSQNGAATLAAIPVDNLRRYETGESVPGIAALKALADAYGHAVDHFYEINPPPPDLEGRPVFFLRTRDGATVDDKLHAKLQAEIDLANQKQLAKIKAKKRSR